MSGVLVLTAVDLEARALARQLGLSPVAARGWPHFRTGALEVAAIGLRACRLEDRTGAFGRPSLVVSAGACGALSPALPEGSLVVPQAVVTRRGDRYQTSTLPGLAAAGTILSVDEVIESASDKARLWVETGARAVDMESAAILAWAVERGYPAGVVRGVSDGADRAVPPDVARMVDADGRVRSLRVVGAALARPQALSDALALRRGTTAALATVAAALAKLART